MSAITPIKRSPYIAALSKDHHEGLLLVWKIKQGVKNNIAPERIAAYTTFFNEHHLKQHFKEEEDLLFRELPAASELRERAFDEHVRLQFLFSEIKKNNGSYEVLLQLADELDKHIRFEERVLFNHLEKVLSEEQLKQIAEALENNETSTAQWEDEFWLNK